MATKKYATTEVLGNDGKPSKTRGIDASNETVEITDKISKKVTLKNVAEAVMDYVVASAEEKAFKEKKEIAQGVIRTFIGNVRDFFAKKNDVTKTYRVLGKEVNKMQYAVDVSSVEKYTFSSKDEDIKSFKKKITVGVFKQLFEEKSTISIKSVVTDDDAKRRELTKILLDVLGEEKVKEYFERSTSYTLKLPLSEKIDKFPVETQNDIWGYIKQSEDMIKDTSYDY